MSGQSCAAYECKYRSHLGPAKAVKVIAFWAGSRRCSIQSADNLCRLKYIIRQEKQLDYGVPMDLIIVNSVNDKVKGECSDYLNSLNGQDTKNGRIIVLHKYNFGISFGAFDFAFQLFQNFYKYWYFCEDDAITVNHGVMKDAIDILESKESNIGFVATIKRITRGYSHPYARGGTGITTREILKKANESSGLPYHSGPNQNSYRYHQRQGERWFTWNIVKKLGYEITITNIPNSTMMWGTTSHKVKWLGDRQSYGVLVPWDKNICKKEDFTI